MESGPRFKVSFERPEKRRKIGLATPGLVVQRVILYNTAAPEYCAELYHRESNGDNAVLDCFQTPADLEPIFGEELDVPAELLQTP